MALGSPTMWLVIAWVVLSVVLIALGTQLRHKGRRGAGWGLVAAGVVVTLAPLWGLLYLVSPLSDPTTIWVEGFEPAKDPGLTVELRHTRDFEDGTEYHFGNAGGPERVAGVFEDQHPDGVVTLGDPPSGPRDNSSIWHLSTDAARYDLTYSADSNWYNLALQVAVLHPAGGGRDLRIPFPRTALDTTALTEGQQYINPWSADQWHDFYRDIPSAEVNGDTITVTSAQGPPATIALGNGVATITIND